MEHPFLDPRALCGISPLPAASTGSLGPPRVTSAGPNEIMTWCSVAPGNNPLQVAPAHGLYARQAKAEGRSNHSIQARKDIAPPLNTS